VQARIHAIAAVVTCDDASSAHQPDAPTVLAPLPGRGSCSAFSEWSPDLQFRTDDMLRDQLTAHGF